jgi:ATP-dependent DNA helicase RecG
LHEIVYSNIFEYMRIVDSLESTTLEFKRELPSPEKIAVEVLAFANTKGGRIVIGYDQKAKEFKDTPASQIQEERISNIISDYCSPRPPYYISYETQIDTDGKPTLLIIDVPEGENKPYFLKNKSLEEGTFVRIGSTSRKASRIELARLIREGQHLSFDRESVITKDELDLKLFNSFLELRNAYHNAPLEKVNQDLLRDLGLVTSENLPTVAGLLLFGKYPQKVPLLEHAYIKLARFKGLEKGYFIDKKEFFGPLTEQLEEAKKFILRNIRMSGVVVDLKREDTLEYPEPIIREILVNALVHRDYSIQGSTIMVSIYDDRIEVSSPGGLEAGVSAENIQSRQYSRNPIIAKRMFDMGYFDSWGQGIDNIIKWSLDAGVKSPLFVDEYNQFTITIYSSSEYSSSKNSITKVVELGEREEKILLLLRTKKRLTNKDIQEELSITKGQSQASIIKLLERSLIEKHGIGRNTYYLLKDQ